MSIEDRVRQLLTDAVANEPPLRGAPLDAAFAADAAGPWWPGRWP
jgi:hypothetical protein